jgi:hypothetical protein
MAVLTSVYPQGIEDLLDVIRQMLVSAEAVLSLVSRSPAEKATEAVLVITPATVGFTTMSIVADASARIVPRLQVTTLPASEHDPWMGTAET